MIYSHDLTSTQFIPRKIFIRRHYSTTHAQVLTTYYITKHLLHWTQDVTNKLPVQVDHQSWFPKTSPVYHKLILWEQPKIFFPPIWDMVFWKRHHLSRIKLRTKITNNYKMQWMLSKSNDSRALTDDNIFTNLHKDCKICKKTPTNQKKYLTQHLY